MTGAELLALYLRQRKDLGERELIFEGHPLDPWRLNATGQPLASGRPAGAPTRSAVAPHVPSGDAEVIGPPRGKADAETAAPSQRSAAIAQPSHAPEIGYVGTGALADLKVFADGCTACGLAQSRRKVVFGEGNLDADVIVVGEAPGADEDASGRPFVGAAGRLLDLLLASVGLPRESVYICNVLKCRPPGNRNPAPLEVDACAHLLHGQISSVRPKAILACGTFAAQTLLATTDPLGRLRTTSHVYQGVPLIPTYHPAALLRNPSWVRSVWTDLQRLRQILDA